MKLRDHPFYERLRTVPPSEVASWSLGSMPIESASKEARKVAFRAIGRDIMSGRAERTRFGFNSDTNGEIARALEWAFRAGQRSVQ